MEIRIFYSYYLACRVSDPTFTTVIAFAKGMLSYEHRGFMRVETIFSEHALQ